MLLHALSDYYTIKVNTKMIEVFGIQTATYWAMLIDIMPRVVNKKYEELLMAYREEAEVVWNEELKRKIPEGWGNGILAEMGEIIAGNKDLPMDLETLAQFLIDYNENK